ncbi:hypothetical protein Q5P01_010149 [Channa striata]|uniref:Uncharacterized protein n=1 Tax=Channa striata TaxID=64152 RepID=A0AA88SSW6_CHASR|nr:hypothetical protein Q5P01_010149 [Channa striata]
MGLSVFNFHLPSPTSAALNLERARLAALRGSWKRVGTSGAGFNSGPVEFALNPGVDRRPAAAAAWDHWPLVVHRGGTVRAGKAASNRRTAALRTRSPRYRLDSVNRPFRGKTAGLQGLDSVPSSGEAAQRIRRVIKGPGGSTKPGTTVSMSGPQTQSSAPQHLHLGVEK